MQLYMLTTTFPNGMLESREFVNTNGKARQAYRDATPSFEILASYKIGSDKTMDIVQAASDSEAHQAANAIAEATATKVELNQITTYNAHMSKLRASAA